MLISLYSDKRLDIHGFTNFTLYREVSRRELFTKIASLLLVLELALF